jgi:hypothetical protein
MKCSLNSYMQMGANFRGIKCLWECGKLSQHDAMQAVRPEIGRKKGTCRTKQMPSGALP